MSQPDNKYSNREEEEELSLTFAQKVFFCQSVKCRTIFLRM